MSSCYSAAELEAMRKAQLKRDLEKSLQNVKEQLQKEHTYQTQVLEGTNIQVSVFADDEIAIGESGDMVITGSMVQTEQKQETPRVEMDFSSLIQISGTQPGRLEQEMKTWADRINERPILTERDASDRNRIESELAAIMKDETVDIEERANQVKMRVRSFLQGAAVLTPVDEARLESEYYEYCALCRMLEVNPTEKVPYKVSCEIRRMREVLEKRKENEYIMDVIESIMEELGCHVKEDAVLDHTVGQIFSVDEHPLCDVFIGKDGSGIMFEPIGERAPESAEKRRQMHNSVNSICSFYAVLEEKAAERGVILRRVYADAANVDQMCMKSDISERRESKKSKRKRKRTSEKQRSMSLEG